MNLFLYVKQHKNSGEMMLLVCPRIDSRDLGKELIKGQKKRLSRYQLGFRRYEIMDDNDLVVYEERGTS